MAVQDLVFEEDHRVRIADRGLEQALGVGCRVGHDHLEAGNVAVPGGVALRVLSTDAGSRAIRAAEDNRRAHLAAGHVERLGGRVDDLVDRLHGKVERHELDDGAKPGHGSADTDTGEAVLGDRGVDHAAGAEFLQQTLRDLVGALVLGHFLTHEEDILIGAHFLGHGVAQRFAHGGRHHFGAFGDRRIGSCDIFHRSGRHRGRLFRSGFGRCLGRCFRRRVG